MSSGENKTGEDPGTTAVAWGLVGLVIAFHLAAALICYYGMAHLLGDAFKALASLARDASLDSAAREQHIRKVVEGTTLLAGIILVVPAFIAYLFAGFFRKELPKAGKLKR